MANTRGVFSLQDVRFAQEDGDWVDPGASFVKNFPFSGTPNVGYFAGGSTPSDVSSLDKMDFTDDTTVLVPSANLTSTNRTLCGFGNRFNAYWSGGRYGGPAAFYSGVEKLSYQTDTLTKAPASNLPTGTADAAGTAIDEYGYICSGTTPTPVTTVNKLVFTHDTVTQSPSSALNTARNGHAAIGNQTACYICGGETPITNNVEKVTFATDTREAVSSTVATLRSVYGASGDNAGYIGGGNDGGPVSTRHKSTVVKFTFSGETTSTLPSANSLFNSVSATQGAGNSTHGYFGGGDGYPSKFSNFTKIQFSDDTRSSVPSGGNLTATRYNGAAACPRGKAFTHSGYIAREQNLKFEQFDEAAYYMGGYGDLSHTSRMDFTTDTLGRNPGASLYIGKAGCQGMASSKAVYAAMGRGASNYSSIDKLTVADQTTARVPANMTNTQYDAAICTSENAGYAAGGLPGPKSSVDKFSFVSDTATLLPGTTFVTPAKYHLGSVSTMKSHGYYAGGITPSANSAVDRIDYATETVGRVQNLPADRARIAGMSGPEFGYFSLGSPGPLTNAVKIQFSTDTVSDSITAISYTPYVNTYSVDQAGNSSTHGYAVGGWQYNSICQKLNYATEQYSLVHTANIDYAGAGVPSGTNNAAFTGTMENHRSLHVPKTTTYNSFLSPAYSGAPDFALINGGVQTPGASTSTDKLTFSTETASISPAQNSFARYQYLAGFSDTTYGWTCGGYNGSPFFVSRSVTDRVTYSTETMVNVPASNMPGSGRYGGGFSTTPSAGYYVSGYSSGGQESNTLKFPLTPGTWSALPSSGTLSSGRYYYQGGGGKDKGYFGGGSSAGIGILTKYDKLTYSTDTMQICSTLNAPDLRGNGSMAGMSRGCYQATGTNPGSPTPNPLFGYFMDFATDTSRTLAGMLTVGKYGGQYAATEREVYWIGGSSSGGLYGTPAYSTLSATDKFSYATETAEKLPSADLSQYRGGGSSMNPRENGVVQPFESNVL